MNTINCNVIGNPVKHSLSPLIHNTLYKKYGIPGKYTIEELSLNDLEDYTENARHSLTGFNVTMPFKESIRKYLDYDYGIYSVNTVKVNDGLLIGYSTDEYGFHNALLDQNNSFSFDGKIILILGAGSVAKSIAKYIKDQNAEVIIQNRTFQKAIDVANELNIQSKPIYDADSLSACDVLVNATPLGMINQIDFKDYSFLKFLKKDAIVFDLNYSTTSTGLQHEADRLGLCSINGLNMLIWQALKAFEIFTNIVPKESASDLLPIIKKTP